METWDALIHMQKLGKIRSIGVSNFAVQHLEALKKHGRPMPTVNQIEMHPMIYQENFWGRMLREKKGNHLVSSEKNFGESHI